MARHPNAACCNWSRCKFTVLFGAADSVDRRSLWCNSGAGTDVAAAPCMHEHADHDQHGRAHVQAPASFGMAFAVGIRLNLTFVAVEFVYGVLANSVALMADAGHNLSDVLGLVIAWIASVLTRRAPSSRFTYGLGGSSILAALFNA